MLDDGRKLQRADQVLPCAGVLVWTSEFFDAFSQWASPEEYNQAIAPYLDEERRKDAFYELDSSVRISLPSFLPCLPPSLPPALPSSFCSSLLPSLPVGTRARAQALV